MYKLQAGFLADAAALRELARMNDEEEVANALLHSAAKNEVKFDAVMRALNVTSVQRFSQLAAALTDSEEAKKVLQRGGAMEAHELTAALSNVGGLTLCEPDEVRIMTAARRERACSNCH